MFESIFKACLGNLSSQIDFGTGKALDSAIYIIISSLPANIKCSICYLENRLFYSTHFKDLDYIKNKMPRKKNKSRRGQLANSLKKRKIESELIDPDLNLGIIL